MDPGFQCALCPSKFSMVQILRKHYKQVHGLSNEEAQAKTVLATQVCCPICFEELVNPKMILCCSNGHAICSECESNAKYCPVCKENFEKKGRPQRAKFSERLIAVYLESIKK